MKIKSAFIFIYSVFLWFMQLVWFNLFQCIVRIVWCRCCLDDRKWNKKLNYNFDRFSPKVFIENLADITNRIFISWIFFCIYSHCVRAPNLRQTGGFVTFSRFCFLIDLGILNIYDNKGRALDKIKMTVTFICSNNTAIIYTYYIIWFSLIV